MVDEKRSLEQLKLVVDSIIWAFWHIERNIAETGLYLLLEMLKNFQVETGLLTEPLWDSTTVPYLIQDLYAEEAAAQRERAQRMRSIPKLIAPNEIQDEMVDS